MNLADVEDYFTIGSLAAWGLLLFKKESWNRLTSCFLLTV